MRTVPLVAGRRRTSVRPRVVLPQPDSPTSPRISPRPTSNVTSSTACTSPTLRRSTPLVDREVLHQVADLDAAASRRCARRVWAVGRDAGLTLRQAAMARSAPARSIQHGLTAAVDAPWPRPPASICAWRRPAAAIGAGSRRRAPQRQHADRCARRPVEPRIVASSQGSKRYGQRGAKLQPVRHVERVRDRAPG